MSRKRLKHLLIPKQFRVWCRPNDPVGDFDITLLSFRYNLYKLPNHFQNSHAGPVQPVQSSPYKPMKTETQVLAEVARIDLSIDETRARMEQTDNQIQTLAKLNEGRRQYLRQLGQARAELLTFELKLE